jgi:hypothetical protein
MPSSGIWRRIDFVWTDFSKERIASIFRVEKSESEEPDWAGRCRLLKLKLNVDFVKTGFIEQTNLFFFSVLRYLQLSTEQQSISLPR